MEKLQSRQWTAASGGRAVAERRKYAKSLHL
jgi:hypothetical protein